MELRFCCPNIFGMQQSCYLSHFPSSSLSLIRNKIFIYLFKWVEMKSSVWKNRTPATQHTAHQHPKQSHKWEKFFLSRLQQIVRQTSVFRRKNKSAYENHSLPNNTPIKCVFETIALFFICDQKHTITKTAEKRSQNELYRIWVKKLLSISSPIKTHWHFKHSCPSNECLAGCCVRMLSYSFAWLTPSNNFAEIYIFHLIQFDCMSVVSHVFW